MNFARKTLMLTLAASGLILAASGTARADSFASAILDISNFRLLHSSTTPFANTDFEVLTGTNDAHATASLDGVFANGAQSFPILSGLNPNVPHQCVPAACPKGEDNFAPFTNPPPVPGTFGYADQALSGSSILIGGVGANAHAQTRADASLLVNGVASGNSDVGTSTTFNFNLGVGDTMTIAFNGTPYTQAFVGALSTPTTNSNARLSWSINIIDLTTGLPVFAYAPTELNASSNVSRTDGLPGTTTYAPGTAGFTATTPFLNATDTYQITIQHNTLANALQAVPEPGTLAVFGFGLLGMSLVSRRRKN